MTAFRSSFLISILDWELNSSLSHPTGLRSVCGVCLCVHMCPCVYLKRSKAMMGVFLYGSRILGLSQNLQLVVCLARLADPKNHIPSAASQLVEQSHKPLVLVTFLLL